MSTALRSAYATSTAMAVAAAVAVTPLTPAADVSTPRLQSVAVRLVAASLPAFGALPYQVLVNQFGNAVALLPTLIGGTAQCTACRGPVATTRNPTASPFTGWGGIGIAVGLLGSPLVLGQTLLATGNAGQALADAAAAISVPVSNTVSMLQADRIIYGGAQFPAARDRAVSALSDTVTLGLQFAGATSIATLAAQVQKLRSTVYADLTSGPTVTTIPTPIVQSAPAAGAQRGFAAAARTAKSAARARGAAAR